MVSTISTKVSAPQLPPVFARRRVFRVLDDLSECPVVWVSGPAGAGKTTAIVSYLTTRGVRFGWYDVDAGDADPATFFQCLGLVPPTLQVEPAKAVPEPTLFRLEYRAGLSVFSRRFFEALFATLPRPSALVFDNYQEAPAEAPLHEVLREAFDVVPPGLRIFVTSRAEPPAAFARALANRRLARVGWSVLRFSEDEARKLVESRGSGRRTRRGDATEIHRITDGWAAGMILLLEAHPDAPTSGPSAGGGSFETVFEYFAVEVLNKVDRLTARVLLATAFLPSITTDAAEAVAEVPEAGPILARLHRQNLFTVRRESSPPAFVYHPLFRAFLLRQAEKKLGHEAVSGLRRRAARVLAEAGQPGEAIDLMRQESDWRNAVPLVLEHAPRLLAAGRVPTLLEWLSWLPQEAFTTDENTWLAFWKASALLFSDPGRSVPLWRGVFERFRAVGDTAGLFLSWAGAVQAVTFEERDFRQLDSWLHELEALSEAGLAAPSAEIEAKVASAALFAFVFRDPASAAARSWGDRAQRAFEAAETLDEQALLGSTVAFYRTLMGDFQGARDTLGSLSRRTAHISDPALRCRLLYAQAFLASHSSASLGEVSTAVDDGLRLAEESGIHLYRDNLLLYGVAAGILGGDRATAKRCLDLAHDRSRSCFAESFYRWTYGWYMFEFEDVEAALSNVLRALDLAEATGYVAGIAFSHVGVASALIELGRLEAAGDHLDRAEELVRTRHLWANVDVDSALVRANWYERQGRHPEAQARLQHALTRARQTRLAAGAWVSRRALSRLCAIALDENIELEFTRAFIRMRRLAPQPDGQPSPLWPWPVKVHALGRFEVQLDDQPLVFQGKAPKVPLRLAKALMAAAGRPVPRSSVLDAFWPDADGDAGKRALDTAIHRLRRLLAPEAVLTEDGSLRLALDIVFVDALQIEGLAGAISDGLERGTRPGAPELDRPLARLLELYQGPFLPGDDDVPGALALRGRLRSAFVKAITACGHALENAGRRPEALALYYRGLAAEDTVEVLYQRALACHAALGQQAEAARLYEGCRQALSRALGTAPSVETRRSFEPPG